MTQEEALNWLDSQGTEESKLLYPFVKYSVEELWQCSSCKRILSMVADVVSQMDEDGGNRICDDCYRDE